jgi:hypothetical protein
VTDNHLAIETHAAADEAKFAISMGRLVEVHEIRVNRGPGDLTSILRVQMQEGLH